MVAGSIVYSFQYRRLTHVTWILIQVECENVPLAFPLLLSPRECRPAFLK
jgi:hypothetical protein